MRRHSFSALALLLSFVILFSAGVAWSKDPPKGKGAGGPGGGGMPPALVVTAPVVSGTIRPETVFIGTLFYKEVSKVAPEVNGLVEEIGFEEGERVEKDKVLVRLGTELLEKDIEAARASYEQVLFELEMAEAELSRTERLWDKDLVTDQAYDENRFAVLGLEKKAASIKAGLGGLKVELEKKSIRAPFSGVVLKKTIERGEWVRPGDAVATLANTDEMDLVVDVPEDVAMAVKKGMSVKVRVAGTEVAGVVLSVIPKGDIPTRTFPVRIRIKNGVRLMEGMAAAVTLPRGSTIKGWIVPRDAVIDKFGRTVVFVAGKGKARMVPVKALGYSGAIAAVASPMLAPGMLVVTKGNERLGDGQSIMRAGGNKNKKKVKRP